MKLRMLIWPAIFFVLVLVGFLIPNANITGRVLDDNSEKSNAENSNYAEQKFIETYLDYAESQGKVLKESILDDYSGRLIFDNNVKFTVNFRVESNLEKDITNWDSIIFEDTSSRNTIQYFNQDNKMGEIAGVDSDGNRVSEEFKWDDQESFNTALKRFNIRKKIDMNANVLQNSEYDPNCINSTIKTDFRTVDNPIYSDKNIIREKILGECYVVYINQTKLHHNGCYTYYVEDYKKRERLNINCRKNSEGLFEFQNVTYRIIDTGVYEEIQRSEWRGDSSIPFYVFFIQRFPVYSSEVIMFNSNNKILYSPNQIAIYGMLGLNFYDEVALPINQRYVET